MTMTAVAAATTTTTTLQTTGTTAIKKSQPQRERCVAAREEGRETDQTGARSQKITSLRFALETFRVSLAKVSHSLEKQTELQQ
jgi:hypothetical protein